MSVTDLRGLGKRLIVDTSEGRPVFLLVGESGTYLRISANTHQFLRQVGQGVSFEQLAKAMCRQGRQVSTSEVEAAYQRLADRIAQIEARAGKAKGMGWFRRRLIKETVVAKLAGACTSAFHPIVAIVMVAAVVATAALMTQHVPQVAPGQFWLSYGVFLVSLLAHEVGHASACARYGAKPSDIGVIVYFIFPSFYSDVTAAWELKRWQRVVVDLGGVYFQLIFGCCCAIGYLLTSWEPLRGTLLLILGSCLFSLNPILKFDGYWIVADALGVTNLATQPTRLVRHVIDLARGRTVRALPWPPLVCAALTIYAVAIFSFWAWFLWRLLPVVGHQVVYYLDVAPAFVRGLLSASSGPEGVSSREFVTSTFMLLFLLAMVWRLIWPALASRLTKHRVAR